MSPPAVAVEGLGKRYEPAPSWFRLFLRSSVRSAVQALDDVSFTVEPGEMCAIAGANGAGKSTLFRILVGLIEATTGRAAVLGMESAEHSLGVRRAIGFVPSDDRSLWLNLSCRTNLRFRGRLTGLSGRTLEDRIDAVLDNVGIAEAADRVGHALSAGMRARLQLACALLHDPPVLILDEPTASVDPVGAHRLVELLQQRARERGTAVLYSTHRVEELEALSASALLLHRGRVIHRGSLDELRSRYDRPLLHLRFTDDQAAADAAARLNRYEGAVDIRATNATVIVSTSTAMGELLGVLGETAAQLVDLRRERQPLRDLLAALLADDVAGEP